MPLVSLLQPGFLQACGEYKSHNSGPAYIWLQLCNTKGAIKILDSGTGPDPTLVDLDIILQGLVDLFQSEKHLHQAENLFADILSLLVPAPSCELEVERIKT